MRKREKRVKAELNRIGTVRAGSGWASRQASRRANRGSRISMRTIRKRMRQRGGGGSS